ncbi:TatD family hydrolase [Prosthecobacter sp. SYSU 5D2]|uniref:TatD family hydrolase n=1 Tax=Prosthecobacter sp. SYSU 5D2 TaxID=3134134 RepID=UPI0031FF4279
MLFDAHNHLHDSRLDPWRAEVMKVLAGCDLAEMVVNGTREDDWQAVADLARQHAWVRPAFGLHPWFVKERAKGWEEKLAAWLREFPQAVVGEIGLDRWIENPDVEAQVECFRSQLEMAKEMERPATIHCLRAWGLLEEELRTRALPGRGFLLHSYGGPAEMISGFVKMGAYFSLSPYFGHPRKAAQLAVFKEVPLERLLAETDAPDMRPPEEMNPHPLGGEEEPLNHPANLKVSYELLARGRGLPMEELKGQLEENYHRLFG